MNTAIAEPSIFSAHPDQRDTHARSCVRNAGIHKIYRLQEEVRPFKDFDGLEMAGWMVPLIELEPLMLLTPVWDTAEEGFVCILFFRWKRKRGMIQGHRRHVYSAADFMCHQ